MNKERNSRLTTAEEPAPLLVFVFLVLAFCAGSRNAWTNRPFENCKSKTVPRDTFFLTIVRHTTFYWQLPPPCSEPLEISTWLLYFHWKIVNGAAEWLAPFQKPALQGADFYIEARRLRPAFCAPLSI